MTFLRRFFLSLSILGCTFQETVKIKESTQLKQKLENTNPEKTMYQGPKHLTGI